MNQEKLLKIEELTKETYHEDGLDLNNDLKKILREKK